MSTWRIHTGDALERLRQMAPESAHCCITSPPYWGLRDYGVEGQIGLELTPDAYIAKLVRVFREVRRVLRTDGTLWLNLGDSYGGSWGAQSQGVDYKAKDLLMIPARVALALRADGWFLRSDIIWAKPNPMPESVTDRPTSAHEHVFLLAKSHRYYYDAEAIKEPDKGNDHARSLGPEACLEPSGGLRSPHSGIRTTEGRNGRGANKRNVWTVATQPYRDAHFATFPEKLVEPMVLAGSPPGGTVLDPFVGSGTTLKVALAHGRDAIGIELNPQYVALVSRRMAGVTSPLFASSGSA